jgi:hypothetical protein
MYSTQDALANQACTNQLRVSLALLQSEAAQVCADAGHQDIHKRRSVQFADMSQEFGYTKVPQPVTTEAQPLQEDLP